MFISDRQKVIGIYSKGQDPRGCRGHRPRDSKGLEGIISSSIMHWRAFFSLFHHF